MHGTDRHTTRLRATRIAALAALLVLALTGTASATVSGTAISWGTSPCCGNTRVTTVPAGATESLWVTFTTPHQLNPSDSITLNGTAQATGVAFPANAFDGSNYVLYDDTAGSEIAVLAPFSPSADKQWVSVSLAGNGATGDITIPAGHQLTLEAVGVTAPTQAGPPADALDVSTTQDPTPSPTPTFMVNPATPTAITVDSGNQQTTGIDSAYAAPLSARVTDSFGNPVAGEHVTFTAPDSGPSGTFASSSDRSEAGLVTNAAGIATSSTFTAGDVAGDVLVSASDTDRDSVLTTFTLHATPDAANTVTLAANPTTLPADGISSSLLTATVTDDKGNPVAGEPVTFTSSDPLEDIGPTVDHGDGTYTATLLAGTSPVPATITATDSSVDPALTGTVDISQFALAPSVAGRPVNDQATSTATLIGLVNPHGVPTSAHFDYGPSSSYGASTPAQDAGSGAADHGVSAPLGGLQPGTTYHYRLVAVSSAGTTAGADMTFTTQAVPAPAPASTTPATTSGSSSKSTTTKKPTTKKAKRRRVCRTVRVHGHRVRRCHWVAVHHKPATKKGSKR